jgi:hypothetical protein
MAFLGAAKQSIEHLLSPAQQAALAAQRASDAAAQVQVAAAAPPVIQYDLCDPVARAAAIAEAQAHGGCVDVAVCDKQGRVAATSRQCWDDPVAKAALVNQNRADEIEAGALERMNEMASADGSNSAESVDKVIAEAGALRAEVSEYEAQAAEDDERLAAAQRVRDRLASIASAARARLGVAS